jgi:hypothetical protein
MYGHRVGQLASGQSWWVATPEVDTPPAEERRGTLVWGPEESPTTRFLSEHVMYGATFSYEQSPAARGFGQGIRSIASALQGLLRFLGRVEESLSAHFTFEDAPAVSAFLGKHPAAARALVALAPAIREVFPTAGRPILRVVTHPDDQDDCEIQALVPVTMDVAPALAKIGEIEDVWWMKLSADVRRLVAVDAVFQ